MDCMIEGCENDSLIDHPACGVHARQKHFPALADKGQCRCNACQREATEARLWVNQHELDPEATAQHADPHCPECCYGIVRTDEGDELCECVRLALREAERETEPMLRLANQLRAADRVFADDNAARRDFKSDRVSDFCGQLAA